jgi:predicted ATPase/DNA-binding CsgD family transcriptional regulator
VGTVTFLCIALDRPPHEAVTVTLGSLDSTLRDIVEEHGGYVFSSSDDPGGGLSAACTTAADAAEAAVAVQRRLLDESTAAPLRVRIGIHTGETTEGERAYYGPEADRATRLTSFAHGGQIVVSDTTELLLRTRTPLRSLGEHRLRDLDRRVRVYQLVADGLPDDFPTLRSAQDRTDNLPEQLTSFVGRDSLLRDVGDLVRANRLVTLGGAGGVGKTRLALEAGAGLADEFPDGVWLIELASVSDASSVPAVIATTLGITPRGDVSLMDAVAEALASRRALILMDNCEHVRAAAAEAAETMLARSETVRILATSREYLWVGDEALVDVPPLDVKGGAASDAAVLFVERARAVRPAFDVHDMPTAHAVTDICRTLDGLPLGIELAAARMAAMSAIEVRDRLGARFRLLRGGQTLPERQQTLLHTVQWSYDLLDGQEQRLLRAASVFVGGFDLPSITAVAAADEIDVLSQLDSLVGKSLVVADHGSGRTRYRLYETIRQFAEERLSESGALTRIADRHADLFADAAAARWSSWNGPGWRDSVDWVAAELGNLRAAFHWSMERGRTTAAVDVAAHTALIGFSVELFESVAWAEEAIEAATAANVPRLPRLLTAAGYACFVGRAEAASTSARRAAELESQPGYDPCEPGYATFVEALGHVYCGRLDRYVQLTRSVAAQFGEDRGYATASYVDGLQASGRIEEALRLVEPAIAAARRLGNPYWIAYALWIAGLALAKADRARALTMWDEAVEHVREHEVHFFDAFLARDAARLHTSDGDAGRAIGLFDTAVGASHHSGNLAQLVITLASVPALLERLDRVEAAAMLFGALSQQPASFHHVPDLAELGDRLTKRLGVERAAELRSAGARLDLNEAAGWTREQLATAQQELARRGSDGRPGGLSRREIDVLKLLAEGRTTGEIAERLFISAKTADHHIQHIYTKIGVSNRAAATRWALQNTVVAGDAQA